MRIQGHYRVSLNGFRCNVSTWDDASNGDGFGDEVFFQIERRYWDGIANLGDEIDRPRDTKTLGSKGDGRYIAGHAFNIFGEHNGLGNGDVFPYLDRTQGHPRKYRVPYANYLGTRPRGKRYARLARLAGAC